MREEAPATTTTTTTPCAKGRGGKPRHQRPKGPWPGWHFLSLAPCVPRGGANFLPSSSSNLVMGQGDVRPTAAHCRPCMAPTRFPRVLATPRPPPLPLGSKLPLPHLALVLLLPFPIPPLPQE